MSKVIEAINRCNPLIKKTFYSFCEELQDLGKMYHFEDDPFDVVDIKTGERIFTDEEAEAMKEFIGRVNQSFPEVGDPMEAALLASDPYMRHYGQLMGKRVVRIVKDDGADDFGGDVFYALVFDDGTTAWILQDEEGNGPGFLDI